MDVEIFAQNLIQARVAATLIILQTQIIEQHTMAATWDVAAMATRHLDEIAALLKETTDTLKEWRGGVDGEDWDDLLRGLDDEDDES